MAIVEKYRVIKASTINELQVRVNTDLQKGDWILQGGIIYDGKQYLQAVKKKFKAAG